MQTIHYNRSMLWTALLPLLLVLVSCVYLLLDGAASARQQFLFGLLQSPYFFYPILLVIILTFCQYAIDPLKKLLRRTPALRWGPCGLTLADGTRVAWAAIENMQLQQHKKQTHILIFLDQPIAFMDMLYGHRYTQAKRHWHRFQTPVVIHCHELSIDAQTLLFTLQQMHQQYLQQAIPC